MLMQSWEKLPDRDVREYIYEIRDRLDGHYASTFNSENI